MTLPTQVSLVEVGPRDGLQNESKSVTIETRVRLIEQLVGAGLRVVEAGAFVSPKWVPQMAGTAEVLGQLTPHPGVQYPVLVPNTKGYELALSAGAKEIALFGNVSETFSRRNINCSIAESFKLSRDVSKTARDDGIRIRGYISCVLGCPYEGEIDPALVANLSEEMLDLGCYEISLGDTIGTGTPDKVQRLIETCTLHTPIDRFAVHFHDTYGQALTNIYASLQVGITTVDSSVAGLGGCPYAHGAAGNVATEDVLYMLNGLGIETGVSLEKLVDTANFISKMLGHEPASRVSRALIAQKNSCQSQSR
jgi:hydroxymethylglutaryl-CoA lyase